MRYPKRKKIEFFNRNFFLRIGAGMAIAMVISALGIGWKSSVHTPPAERLLDTRVEASSSSPAVLANYDWTVQSLDGQDLPMAHAKGKVVFLNFWATWCSPCVAEMASIQRLYEKLKDKGIVFLCISNEDAPKVGRFVKRKRYTFPIYIMLGSPPAVFNTQRVPTTFILSRDGRIVFKHTGSAKWDDNKTIELLKGLLK